MLATKPDKEWREILNDEEYKILRQKATEVPFSGEYNDFFETGVYNCKACGQSIFSSSQKFASSCGWPSFESTLDKATFAIPDFSHEMERTEIICSHCGSHLGHLFNDGPTQTGQRYCINSLSLEFDKNIK